jgi:hypothetical protein
MREAPADGRPSIRIRQKRKAPRKPGRLLGHQLDNLGRPCGALGALQSLPAPSEALPDLASILTKDVLCRLSYVSVLQPRISERETGLEPATSSLEG